MANLSKLAPNEEETNQLTTNFKNVVQKYYKTQTCIASKTKQVLTEEHEQQLDIRSSRIASLRLNRLTDQHFEEKMLLDREKQILQMENDIIDLHDIFKNLNELVKFQTENIGELELISIFSVSN